MQRDKEPVIALCVKKVMTGSLFVIIRDIYLAKEI